MQETQVGYLGWEDTLEKETATHSSILAWETPWTDANALTPRDTFPFEFLRDSNE